MEINLLKNFYEGKKILITGHTGFKGAWLTTILNDFGSKIFGYALKNENTKNLYQEICGDKFCNSIISDIRNKVELEQTIIKFQPDLIFHLAAQPLVRHSYKFPLETFEINAIGTANLLQSLSNLKKKCSIIIITTDKVYHNFEWPYPYRESDKLGGYDPYSASKSCAELIIDSYRNSFYNLSRYDEHKKSISVARAGNVIGGGDWAADRIIPDIVKSFISNNNINLRNPQAIRPWQHVIEPLFGYLQLGVNLYENPKFFSNAYNFGPYLTDNLTVEQMTNVCIKSLGNKNISYTVNDSNNPHEAGTLKLDINKTINELNWKPIFTSLEAIEMTIKWYKDFYDGENPLQLMRENIETYKNKINE